MSRSHGQRICGEETTVEYAQATWTNASRFGKRPVPVTVGMAEILAANEPSGKL
jgi:hypothetical protein